MKKVIFKINQHWNFSFQFIFLFSSTPSQRRVGSFMRLHQEHVSQFSRRVEPFAVKIKFRQMKTYLEGRLRKLRWHFQLVELPPTFNLLLFPIAKQNSLWMRVTKYKQRLHRNVTWRDHRARPSINAKLNFLYSFRTIFFQMRRERGKWTKYFSVFHSFLSWSGNLTMRSWCPKSVIIDPNDGNMIFGVICWLISERSSFTSCFTWPSFTSQTRRAPVTDGN